jgi:hypothetical protein
MYYHAYIYIYVIGEMQDTADACHILLKGKSLFWVELLGGKVKVASFGFFVYRC